MGFASKCSVMVTFDPKLYKRVLSQDEGMNHKEYRKVLARYVSTLSEVQRADILSRKDEILAAELEWRELNSEVLTRLGFNEVETGMLCDKRLDSPGVRMLIKRRADEIKRELRGLDIARRVR